MVARPVVQFAIIGAAASVIVGLAIFTASQRIGQREAITDARTTTLVQAQGLVEPQVTSTLTRRDPVAVAKVADVVERRVVNASLVRVKIWNAAGTIVYSNDADLEGQTFPLGDDEVEALRDGLIEADVSDLTKPENLDERQYGKLLEVYLPIRAPDGTRLLFEAYFRYGAVSASGARIWRSFAPVSLGGLALLEVLQVPVAWSLARRLRQRQQERESLLRRALEASEVERRRIASDLHDGVVQDLAGVALNLAGAARHRGMPTEPAELLEHAAASVRSSITALRTTLVDIFPPGLAQDGLIRAALQDLAADSAVLVICDVSGLPDRLPDPIPQTLYRVAREALRNASIHGEAETVILRADLAGNAVWIEIYDDGTGFEPEILPGRVADGHLGLIGLDGMVSDAGGRFSIESAPRRGTTIKAIFPLP
jgi:two-component system NarL family sensor kinase